MGFSRSRVPLVAAAPGLLIVLSIAVVAGPYASGGAAAVAQQAPGPQAVRAAGAWGSVSNVSYVEQCETMLDGTETCVKAGQGGFYLYNYNYPPASGGDYEQQYSFTDSNGHVSSGSYLWSGGSFYAKFVSVSPTGIVNHGYPVYGAYTVGYTACEAANRSGCDQNTFGAEIAPPPGPYCSTALPSGSVVGMATTADGNGYWIASSTGQVAACGDALWFPTGSGAKFKAVAIVASTDGYGFMIVFANGGVGMAGDFRFYGSAGGTTLAKPIVAAAVDPATGGYWMLGGDGGVFSFNAPFFGSTGNIRLAKPAVGLEATLTGKGYRFVASDGGIFDYGDARFYGSTGNVTLNQPIVGMADDPQTGGYWLDASDGGIFSFNAPFYGSTGNIRLAQPCVGMSAMPDGRGYRFVAADGGIFNFGDAHFEGSAA